MTSSLVPTLVPSLAMPPRSDHRVSPGSGSWRPLPVAPLLGPRDRSTVYGLAAVDARGRVADHAVMRALGWRAGTPLNIKVICGLIVVTAGDDGQVGVTNQGDVRLPAAVRYACGIERGDRVLLAAEPAEGVLVVHPPATLDTMFGRVRAQVMAGEAA
jgi:hypothetical protein